ncbi:MAG: hypothetical protein AAGU10_12235 [Methanosarcina mazei]|uniref:hypothetical protein n=1 Tax=Methanosarcina soligelidi TaxID=1036677 RepID=UPI00064E5013|nr:hypothetical protein [Methanosarcina soligelidi]
MEQFQGTISEYLKQSVETGKLADSDCQEFKFGDVKIGIEIKGKVCKSGKVEACITIANATQCITADLSKGEACGSTDLKVIEVKYCLYLKGSCLWTKGYIGNRFYKDTWDEQIICLQVPVP